MYLRMREGKGGEGGRGGGGGGRSEVSTDGGEGKDCKYNPACLAPFVMSTSPPTHTPLFRPIPISPLTPPLPPPPSCTYLTSTK